MRALFILSVFCCQLFFSVRAEAQNYIGFHKDRIIEEMNKDHRKFKLNRGAVNPHYNYLKYEDRINEITLLFFLSEDDECTLVRKICDYSNINEILGELNEKYTKTSENNWVQKKDSKNYTIQLTEDEWYFTVTIKKKE